MGSHLSELLHDLAFYAALATYTLISKAIDVGLLCPCHLVVVTFLDIEPILLLV